jgi:transposase
MTYLTLTTEQVNSLRRLTHTATGRVALRALMVLWRAEGLTTLDIAQRLGCNRESVTPWIERYQRLGVAGLEDEPRQGRPPRLDATQRDQAEAHLERSPPESETVGGRWTLARLGAVLRRLAPQPFSGTTLRRVVHALGFRWRRPRLWPGGQDPERFEKALLIELAQQHAGDHPEQIQFCYADASDQHLLAVLRGMWMRIGQQVRIATPPDNQHWSLFGCLHPQSGAFVWQAFEKAVSASFLAFLEYLRGCYPTGDLVVVVDNASYHKSKAVIAWLKEHPQVLLLYLPKYAPQLNPVEKIWAALKDRVSANRSFANLLVLGQFIRAFFDELTPARTLKLAGLRNDFCHST